ncbi:histidine phosphatase family protein [Terrabacter sp. BE26]|uniref:histidine phosphatase family protein n=1 Tax=Terrabacter sp. BE26 TaxID=2898152 RepID=UPI0035BE1A3F
MAIGGSSAPWAASMEELVLVRHGESVGNVADAQARDRGDGRLQLDTRDPDTPLSERGEQQAHVLARHVASTAGRPDVVLSSPYARAEMTARIVGGALDLDPLLDERLRERDLGIFDGLTGVGIRKHYPEEAERRARLGKFYYRPPGGESWTDVALRVRDVLRDLGQLYPDRRVWVFTHQVVIMSFRLALESLDEATLLDVDRHQPLANCSLTRYRRASGALQLEAFADTAYLEASPVDSTHEDTHQAEAPDPPAAGHDQQHDQHEQHEQPELQDERTT